MSQLISLLYHILLLLTAYLKQYYCFQNAEMQAFPKAIFSDYCFLNIFNKKMLVNGDCKCTTELLSICGILNLIENN